MPTPRDLENVILLPDKEAAWRRWLRRLAWTPRMAFAGLLALLLPGYSAAYTRADRVEELQEGTRRFWPAGADQDQHSFALQKPVSGTVVDDVPTSAIFPRFKNLKGASVAEVEIADGTSLYGTGEVAGGLLRNGKTIETWNTDNYGYDKHADRLYQSHPWVLALRKDGSAFGVLADTTWRCRIRLKGSIRFESQGPPFPVYVIEGKSPQEVLKRLAVLTGTMALPPKWALGYQQCRYSYYPDSRVREIARGFRDRNIPCDVLWLDIHYMDGYRIFTFDPKHFPDPKELNADLHDMGYHQVWMIDPGVKAEPGYFVYDQGSEKDAWVKRADGRLYLGEVWPGLCVFPDFTRENVRSWWSGLYKDFMATGVDGVWNDMNEPAVFKVESKTMPLDNRHEGFGGGPHARFHNVYGALMVKASRKGIMDANPVKRPFVLSRANYIGGHRDAAAWTGDNTANWEHLADSVPMVLNLGLSGQPFAGPDIGGFAGNATPELFARWMGIGALLPFSRAHTADGTEDQEPWSFGKKTEDTSRVAIERRYRLLPYLYTVFEEAARTGLPVARPVFFADPADPKLRKEQASFLIGSDLMVLTQPRARKRVEHAMPKGDWKRLDLDQVQDPDLPELRLRPGAILPVGPLRQYTGEKVEGPLKLFVHLDPQGKAEGEFYEDEGDGYGYLEGSFVRMRVRAATQDGKVTVSLEQVEGKGANPWNEYEVFVLGLSGSHHSDLKEALVVAR